MKKFFRNLTLTIAVVFVWRGLWGLTALYIFPNNELVSLIVPMAIGLIILIFHHKDLSDLM